MRCFPLNAYRCATTLIAPLMPFWLRLRLRSRKEDAMRLRERYGFASKPRPAGPLLWLHAASVGESMSVLLLLEKLKERSPSWSVLVTTGTVTSARLMAARLPAGMIHQYVPLDVPEYTERFMRHWRPEIAFFVESELWPNLILAADREECFLGIVNGRMSARSFTSWQKYPQAIRDLLSRFDIVFAQGAEDAERFRALGAKRTEHLGNLKYDAAALPCDEGELLSLKTALGARPVWLAASTHPGEEEIIARCHTLLAAKYPELLTIIAPRHPARGPELMGLLSPHGAVALRSRKQPFPATAGFYIADTLGELGLFYRLSEIAFMGGSLIRHGGQNPLEPARLSCAIASGPHVHNFEDAYRDLLNAQGCLQAETGKELPVIIDQLLSDPARRHALGGRAKDWTLAQAGAADALLARLLPLLDARTS